VQAAETARLANGRAPEREGPLGDGEGPSPLADFAVDRSAEVPIGVQLAWALRARIGDGRFQRGLRLPGLRDLAESLSINANTVRAVYARLEQDGLLETRQGSGTFVARSAASAQPQASAIAAGAAREARRSGVDPREVAAALYVDTHERSTESPQGDSEMPRRVRLRSQIAALEQTLSELEADYPSLSRRITRQGMRSPHDRPATARLPTAADLEQIRLMLVRRLTYMQSLIDAIEGDGEGVERPESERADPVAAETPASAAERGRSQQPSTARRAGKKQSRPATAST
jgi:DNA-binding transcriptional regulator YhcF (GntR family)